MATDLVQMEQIARQVQGALQTADLTGYQELLDPCDRVERSDQEV